MRASFAETLVALVLVACSRVDERAAAAASDAAPAAQPTAMASSRANAIPTASASTSSAPMPSIAPSAATDIDTPMPEGYLTAKPIRGKSVGHTSVVFKLTLEGGLEAAFKPRSRRGGGRYRGEVAARRLAEALGITNVPPAILRAFDEASLRAAVGGEKVYEEVLVSASGKVPGALIPWIKPLELLDLEKDPWWSRWRGWLARGGVMPESDRPLAAQISTMVVFDYVTGNWDRWSGGNIAIDRAHGRLLFIDNDGAFYDSPPADALKRQRGLLEGIDRFAGAFVRALRGADLRKAIGDEAPGNPLLTARGLASLEVRRKEALAIIDRKIAEQGEAHVLSFP